MVAIPARLEDLTAPWLEQVLRTSPGADPDVELEGVRSTVLGTGIGFAGDLARLEPTYRRGRGPSSVVAKIPTSIEDNRAGSELLGVYERELRVYQELLPVLDVPAAAFLHGAIEPNPIDAERQIAMVRRADRLPVWFLRGMGRAMRSASGRRSRRAVLVVEDLAPAEVGDQVAGCDPDAAAAVLRAVARLHAGTLGDACPEPTTWLQRADVAPRIFHALYLDSRKGFERRADGLLSPHTRELLRGLGREGPFLIRRIHDTMPECVLHGDLRLDNVFFAADGSVRALIDWQLANLGPPLVDVAYFLTGSLDVDATEHDVDDLLGVYHAALVDAGVGGYPLSRIIADYELVLALMLHRVASLDGVEFGDDRGVALVDAWVARVDRRMDRLTRLPTARPARRGPR